MDVANDRDFRIKRERGPDNIRVMSSEISDTTAQIAISNVMLDDAFESGDIESEIMKTDEPEKYRRKYHRIISMEQDYKCELPSRVTLADFQTTKKLANPHKY